MSTLMDGATDGARRATYAVAIATAVGSAALLLWLAAGDGDSSESYRGLKLSCIYRFEDGGGDTTICDRVSVGAGVNALGQLAIGAFLVVCLFKSERILWARAALTATAALTILCYVLMRSWEFGEGWGLL